MVMFLKQGCIPVNEVRVCWLAGSVFSSFGQVGA